MVRAIASHRRDLLPRHIVSAKASYPKSLTCLQVHNIKAPGSSLPIDLRRANLPKRNSSAHSAPNECQNLRAMRAPATPFGNVRRKINCLLLRMPVGMLDAFLRPTCVFFLLLRGTVSPPTGSALGAFFGQKPVTRRASASAQHGRVFLPPPAPIWLPWRPRTEMIGSIRVSGMASSTPAALCEAERVTYCVGVKLDGGMVFASDSRTNAGLDNIAKFCKMTLFDRIGDRVLVLLSSGNLAGTQAIISLLTQRNNDPDNSRSLSRARTMFDAANLVSDAMRDIERRDGPSLEASEVTFNASFILGGQIGGEEMRLFRIYAEGNFIESSVLTPYIQTGETKYGKPIIDRVITSSTNLADAAKCVLVSFDSTMRSNISVGMPIDLVCYERDSLQIHMRRRFDDGDPYFTSLHRGWSEGTRKVFSELPDLVW